MDNRPGHSTGQPQISNTQAQISNENQSPSRLSSGLDSGIVDARPAPHKPSSLLSTPIESSSSAYKSTYTQALFSLGVIFTKGQCPHLNLNVNMTRSPLGWS
jgi:hypothetical protein